VKADLAPKVAAPEIAPDIEKTDVAAVAAVAASNDGACSVTPTHEAGVADVATPGKSEDSAEQAPFPPASERPAYVVLEDWAEHRGRKYRPGVWYCTMTPEKKNEMPGPVETWICAPLYVEAVTRDPNGRDYGRLLRFRNTDCRWCEWAMPMAMLAGSGEEMRAELLSQGLEMDPKARQQLPMYIQSKPPLRRLECATATGWHGDTFVLPDETIGPRAQSVVFQSAEHATAEYGTAGTLEGWREHIASLAEGNPLLLVALSAAFAGPVLYRCQAESGGIHLWATRVRAKPLHCRPPVVCGVDRPTGAAGELQQTDSRAPPRCSMTPC
jgi:putative DNA primase/helicase